MNITTIRYCLVGVLFILIPKLVFTQLKIKNNHSGTPKIYLVGTVHSMHFNPAFHYTINDLLNQVTQLNPDVVCGEITPEAFKQNMEGYFPLEASALSEMAKKHNYHFVPVDWRIDLSTQVLAESIFPEDVKKVQTDITNDYTNRINKFAGVSLYDFIHAPENINVMDSLFEKVVASNPVSEIAMGSWHERNRRIVENSLQYLKSGNVVVFVFGAAHLPQIKRQLEALGYKAEIPERFFTPSDNMKFSPQVINRWKKNLSHLTSIRDRKINSSFDDYQKVVRSKRIEELTQTLNMIN